MFKIFNKTAETSAGNAKQRLQLMISTQRLATGDSRDNNSSIDPTLLYKIQTEIMLVIEKYVKMDRDELKVEIKQDGDHLEILEVSVPISN